MAVGDNRVGVNRRFGRGFGSVALEVFSVVLGVLVALGVDGWRAERELQARADHARAAIVAEIQANLTELDDALPSLEAVAPETGSVDLELPEFSRAAWQTSQVTDATSRLDFDWLIEVAKAYETQALYAQLGVELVRTMAELGASDQAVAVARLRGQVGVLVQVHRALAAAYREILAGEGS